MPKRRKRGGWRKGNPDAAMVAQLLRDVGFVACDSDPIEISAWYDSQNLPRRVDAHYAGGIRARLHIGVNGGVSLTQSIQIKVSTK